jgi:hypothetical protein
VTTLLTPADLADKLKIDERTLASWRYHRRGPKFIRLERHVRYRTEDVDDWLDRPNQASVR